MNPMREQRPRTFHNWECRSTKMSTRRPSVALPFSDAFANIFSPRTARHSKSFPTPCPCSASIMRLTASGNRSTARLRIASAESWDVGAAAKGLVAWALLVSVSAPAPAINCYHTGQEGQVSSRTAGILLRI